MPLFLEIFFILSYIGTTTLYDTYVRCFAGEFRFDVSLKLDFCSGAELMEIV
jgi:hypothetical protein